MKTLHSEEYYRNNWDEYMKKVSGEHYINLEGELEYRLAIFAELPKEALEILKKVEAKKIADNAKAMLLQDMDTVKRINAGDASFGYTTKIQEVRHTGRFVRRFEFNCLQLADFKKKYNV